METFLFCYIVFTFISFFYRFGQTISSTAASALWPLVAVSHQMTVRDVGNSLEIEQPDGLVSRV